MTNLEYIWQTAGGLRCGAPDCGREVAYRKGDDLYCHQHAPIPEPKPINPDDRLTQAAYDALAAEQDGLRNLLAVIHRDGGHYYTEHGSAKAVKDAMAAVIADRVRADAVVAERNEAQRRMRMLVPRLYRVRPNENGEGGETWEAWGCDVDMQRMAAEADREALRGHAAEWEDKFYVANVAAGIWETDARELRGQVERLAEALRKARALRDARFASTPQRIEAEERWDAEVDALLAELGKEGK